MTSLRLSSCRWMTAVALALLTLGLAPSAGFAQEASIRSLTDRLDRLQRDLDTLQRAVYRGETPSAEQLAQATAPSETTARLAVRVSQMEAELRSLTGQVEEINHRNRMIEQRLDNLVGDVDARLRVIEGALGTGGDGAQLSSGSPTPLAGQGGSQAAGQVPAATTDPNAAGVQTLGTVSAAEVAAVRAGEASSGQAATSAQAGQQSAAAPATLPSAPPQEAYHDAFTLLRKGDYAGAESALQGFLAAYREDPLAGNAKYWLGETYYVRQRYAEAAVTFAEGFQEYPNSSKAPDNLLKLGKSLAALGQAQDACDTLAELLKRYPNAANTLRKQAQEDRAQLGCS